MPDNVRLFLLSNLQHAAPANAKSELTRTCAFPSNPLYAGPPLRALLVALERWITRRHAAAREPLSEPSPTARWSSRGGGRLSAIPGVTYSGAR